MKKILASFLVGILLLVCFSLVACDNENRDGAENSYIELTMDNYNYYLSISKVLTDSGSYGAGSFRYASYQATISGAIDGIYVGCIIYYKLGQDSNLQSVTLNAAGFAQFKYAVVNGKNIIYTKVEGKIYL